MNRVEPVLKRVGHHDTHTRGFGSGSNRVLTLLESRQLPAGLILQPGLLARVRQAYTGDQLRVSAGG